MIITRHLIFCLFFIITNVSAFKEPELNLEETFRTDGRKWPYFHISQRMNNVFPNAAPRPQNVLIEKELFYLYDYYDHRLNTYEDLLMTPDGYIKYKKGKIIFTCFGPLDIFKTLKPLKDPPPIHLVQLCECNITVPIADVLKWLNVNVSRVDSLLFSISNILPLSPGNYTHGLKITNLSINIFHTPDRDFFEFNKDFMQPLSSLTSLLISGTTVPPLPRSMKLEMLELREHAKIIRWQNCQHITSLNLYILEEEDIPDYWPSVCKKIIALRLNLVTSETVERLDTSGIDVGCKNLRYLIVRNSKSKYLPIQIINAAKNITYLDLSYNHLVDKLFVNFPMLVNLYILDLSYNDLTGWILFDLVKQVPNLRNLKLDGNKFVSLLYNFETKVNSFAANLRFLEWLSIDEMVMSPDCFANTHFSNLKYLGLRAVQTIDSLDLQKLPKTNATSLTIDMRGNTILKIAFTKKNYDTIHNGSVSRYWDINRNITLMLDYIDCDCENYWFANVHRQTNFISLPGLRCKSGLKFPQEPLVNMYCVRELDDGCWIRNSGAAGKRWMLFEEFSRTSTIECHNKKHFSYTYYQNYKTIGLNASDNFIPRISFTILKSLKWIDLRRNQISRANDTQIKVLFENNRTVWLSGNPFICDCDNRPMLDGFQEYRDQIKDYYEIKCIETGKPMYLVSTAEICQDGLRDSLMIGGILSGAILIMAVLLWHYRLQIRVYLYSRGWCLFCLNEGDVDSDKIYDAFLSYAHGDEDYVVQELLPKLEEHSYRICVHYRDWVVGDWIPAQIARSVSVSKRTILVLSRNFVVSLWGSLEFRYAMASSVQDGRQRMLVLVLDDVLSQSLSPELKGYLSYNTYLRCDDPLFWDKLRYAMPHHKRVQDEPLVRPIPIGQFNMTPLSELQTSRPITIVQQYM